MKKELATQEQSTELVSANLEAWGPSEISSDDIILSKIVPQQGLSKFVTEGKARFGDFCDSLTGEVLSNIEKGLEIVPFYMEKIWIITQKLANSNKFIRIDQIRLGEENLPWEFIENGLEYKRVFARNFYVLLPGIDLPYIISFKSSSSQAGKVMATQMGPKNSMAKLSPAATTMTLKGQKKQNDKGTYVVLEVCPLKRTSPEMEVKALDWFRMVKSGKTKADISDIVSTETQSLDDSPSVF